MRPYNLADLTALRSRLPGFMSDMIFSQILGYTIEVIDETLWLTSPFPAEAPLGPCKTKWDAWHLAPQWRFLGPRVIELMKAATERDPFVFSGEVYGDYDEAGIYHETIKVRWRLRGVSYRGESIFYGHAAMLCYLDYLGRQLRGTTPLAADEARI